MHCRITNSKGRNVIFLFAVAQTKLTFKFVYGAVGVGGVCTFWFGPAVGNVSLDSYSNGIDTNIGTGVFGQAWLPPTRVIPAQSTW
jgi:hypothetical protein